MAGEVQSLAISMSNFIFVLRSLLSLPRQRGEDDVMHPQLFSGLKELIAFLSPRRVVFDSCQPN
jgi:hypothetical protein